MDKKYKYRHGDEATWVPLHHRWTPYVGPVVWTGPNGDRHHRLKIDHNWQLLGVGEVSPEKTLSCTYLSRALPSDPFPSPRGSLIGEIGWFNEKLGRIQRTPPIVNPR